MSCMDIEQTAPVDISSEPVPLYAGMHVPSKSNDLEQVAPGIFVSKRAIEAAVKGTEPETDHDLLWEKARKAWQEIKDDITVSKEIVDKLAADAAANRIRAQESGRLMQQAVERQNDPALFVDVTAMRSIDAAERALRVKGSHPTSDVHPVDLTGVLNDVRPLYEASIDAIVSIIGCRFHQEADDMPRRVMFAVPAATDGTSCDMHRYVRLGALPEELQDVINATMSAGAGFAWDGDEEIMRLLRRINKLRDKVSSLLQRQCKA